MDNQNLSGRQQDILGYIKTFVQREGYPPAIRQIQEDLKISSTSVVAYNLRALEQKGFIRRSNKISRGIELLLEAKGSTVPMLGAIAAGLPIPVPGETMSEEDVEVPEEIGTPDRLKDVYALRVKGHSMIDALVDDGDIVLLRYQERAENGQMVAVRLREENEVTLKRIYWEGERVRLQPANVTMNPIYVAANNVEVQGRVVGVIRRLG
jgi:repressor LexA